MSRKITIIGAGSVGSTIAYSLSQEELASQIVMIDINKDKAEGEVMDIEQGTCFREPISIIAGDYPDAKDSDIVIITSGIARKPGQTRIDLAQTNVNILKSITPQIVKEAPNALYVIVSNPVDIMTYVFTKISGLPERQIIGSGTILDTARLRCGLSEKLQVAQKNIHAYVFGEHGDTSFIPWTGVYVSGIHVDEYVNVAQHMGKDVKRLSVIAERFSKIGSKPEMKFMYINEVLVNATDYMRRRISNKVQLMTHLPEEPIGGMYCLPLLEWVIENLCKNAIDAMDGEGSIDVSLQADKDKCYIDVRDTGKGIPRKRFKTVFNPGYTTKKRGWGLGLTLVKRIIEEYHEGRIYVKESEPGKGTTFRIELKRS